MRRYLLACVIAAVAAPSAVYAETVTCTDGTKSEAGRGACSHHGGIARARTTRDKATIERDGEATVTCTDGTQSQAGRGACSHHGGVAKARTTRRDKADTRTERDGEREARRTTSQRSTRDKVERDTREPLPGAFVRCADGTTTIALGRGACSHHGGVADEDATEAKTKRADAPWWNPESPTRRAEGKPLARCRDGSLSYSKHHMGACSYHGGVRDWLDD
jgi:hypothetical protein